GRRYMSFSRDWSSDVCSSDLHTGPPPAAQRVGQVIGAVGIAGLQQGFEHLLAQHQLRRDAQGGTFALTDRPQLLEPRGCLQRQQIGRASCRESLSSLMV